MTNSTCFKTFPPGISLALVDKDCCPGSLIYDDLGTDPGHQDPPFLALTSGPDCLAYGYCFSPCRLLFYLGFLKPDCSSISFVIFPSLVLSSNFH